MIGGEHLYLIQMDRTGVIKIGRSSNPEKRLKQLQTSCPYELRIILVLQGEGHRERDFHRRLRRYNTRRYQGEWFEERGLTSLPDEVYEMIDLEQRTWWEKTG